MQHPTREQWQTVLDKLYSALPFALEYEGQLNMDETEVNIGHECGTVHCIGGWYAIGHWQESAFSGAAFVDFRHGADQMAKDLGFAGRSYLASWILMNPRKWGNGLGNLLFQSAAAWNNPKDLADVIRYLEKVADNCLNKKS